MTAEPPRELIESCRPAPAANEVRQAAWQAEMCGDESEAFRRAFEDAAIGMAIVDLDGRFQKVNRSLCEMLGYSAVELQSRTFQDITHPDDLESDLALARRMFSGEISHYHMEKRYLHNQGHVIWILLSGSLIRDADGRPCYCVSQIQNITDRKLAQQQAELQVRNMQRLTDTANQLLRAFETGNDESVYERVLEIALTAFDSEAGLFLRFDQEGQLIGPYRANGVTSTPRCPPHGCKLWSRVLAETRVIAENAPRPMGCGMTLSRSLAGPILYNEQALGVMHLGNSAVDYTQDECDLLARVLQLIGPALYARMRLAALTVRETEVMDLLVMGLSQKKIATTLKISVQTVAKHRARVLQKLAARGDVDLVYFALKKRVNRLFDPAFYSSSDRHQDGVVEFSTQSGNVSGS